MMSAIYGVLVYIVLSKFRQENIGIYLLAIVNFWFGLWVGIVLVNVKLSFQKALFNGIIAAIIMLIAASLTVSAENIISGTSLNVLKLNMVIIWLIGGGFFLLWIFLGTLIRLRK